MKLLDTIRLYAYGTTEGAFKGWEHRPRSTAPEPTGTSISIGHAEPGDFDQIYEMDPGTGNKNASTAVSLLNSIADLADPEHTLIARDPSGMVLGACYARPAHRQNWFEVEALATNPDVIRGLLPAKGVGTRLMVEVAKQAASRGSGVLLAAVPGAVGFYRKMGMTEDPPMVFKWTPEQAKSFAQYGALHAGGDAGFTSDEVKRMLREAMEEEAKNPPLARKQDEDSGDN